nr:MAG TPA: hypothetical protein [Caudoviricetes sp.]
MDEPPANSLGLGGASCFICVHFLERWLLWQQQSERFPAWLCMASKVFFLCKNEIICSTSLHLQK